MAYKCRSVMVECVVARASPSADVVPLEVMARLDRRDIDVADLSRAIATPTRKERQADGRVRHRYWVPERQRWLRVVTEADGETVHNAFRDRNFEP